jgi:GrpB-like predicted nucleotidyltransferase (UPF0157 family)
MSLGLKRGTVKLVSHNPDWQKLFEEERKLLMDAFGDAIIAIEHVGSTAIPGIPAKAILDMNVGVQALGSVDNMKEQFFQLDYEFRGHQGEKNRQLLVKGPEANRTHHANVIVFGSEYWTKDLLFRDYLRANKAAADEYGKFKQELAEAHSNDRHIYTNKKAALIKDLLERARQWKKKSSDV